jgi:hypothetical protein
MADILNENLTLADFTRLPQSDQDAFARVPAPRVVLLNQGFELYKLTVAPVAGRVSSWWSSFGPYEEDKEGAHGRYLQAQMNGIDMSAMARFMAAVRLDWNQMNTYLQVKLTRPAKAFWGAFAPQDLGLPLVTTAAAAQALNGAHLPDTLGVLQAWQFYIPNIGTGDIQEITQVNGHDMNAIAPLLGYVPHAA